MNFSLVAALALAFAAPVDARLSAPEPELIGAVQFPFLEAHCEGCQPNYCYPSSAQPDYKCYK